MKNILFILLLGAFSIVSLLGMFPKNFVIYDLFCNNILLCNGNINIFSIVFGISSVLIMLISRITNNYSLLVYIILFDIFSFIFPKYPDYFLPLGREEIIGYGNLIIVFLLFIYMVYKRIK